MPLFAAGGTVDGRIADVVAGGDQDHVGASGDDQPSPAISGRRTLTGE
jgi:hypothetical protein